MTTNLFIYGLFRDQAQKLLGDFKSLGRDSVSGKIYKVNEFYPGYKKGFFGKVWGEVIQIDDDIFPELDKYEGDEYERIKIKTSNKIECWIYHYKGDVSKFRKITTGDWMLR